MTKVCILLDIIKRARSRRVSVRQAEDLSIMDAVLYRTLAQVRTHYTYLGLSSSFETYICLGQVFQTLLTFIKQY